MDRKISSILLISIIGVTALLASSFLIMNSLESKIKSEPVLPTPTLAPTPTITPEAEEVLGEQILEEDVVYSDWDFLVEVIESCQATSITQLHNLDVIVTLENGLSLTSQEPEIDEVFRIYNAVSEECGEIPIATE